MKKLKLIALIGILAMALWVPAASASLITLTNTDTLTLTMNQSPTITRSASASISGVADYSPSEGPYSAGPTSGYTTVAIPGGYTWLTTISATNAAGSSSNNFSGTGPLPSGSTLGYINETATTSQFYTFTLASGKNVTFTDSYSYSYSLSNATGNQFVDVTWYTKAELFLNGVSVASSTPINVSQTVPPGQFLADIGPISSTGTLTYARTGGNNLPTGTYTYELRLTSYELGHTSAIPIPGSVLLLGSGLLGLVGLGWRRARKES